MTDQKSKASIGFWLIATAALIWNGLGTANFLYQLSPDNIASLPETHRDLIEGRSIYGTIAFGVGVIGGVVGSILLLLRQFWAVPVFAISFIGIVATVIPTIRLINEAQLSTAEVSLMVIVPIFVGLLLWLYARKVAARGWFH